MYFPKQIENNLTMPLIKAILGPLLFLLGYYSLQHHNLGPAGGTVVGVLLWMLCWWLLEVVPLAVTALIPLLVFPLFHVLPFKDVASLYTSEVIFLFLGGFFLSTAVEKWNLHVWISQHIVKAGGSTPLKLVFSFMFATAFISMWISNTAATLIMLPLVKSLLRHSHTQHKNEFSRALLLGVAFAASIGGLGTPIGSPPNAILFAYIKNNPTTYPDITFLGWMVAALPMVVLSLFILGFLLNFFYLRHLKSETFNELYKSRKDFITSQNWEPPMTRVATVFACMTLLWITAPLMGLKMITDAWISVAGALFLFLLPSGTNQADKKENILSAQDFDNQPWNILILFGGGLALSEGLQRSRLIEWISQSASFLHSVHPFAVMFLSILILILMTEIGSNTAIAAIFVPLAGALSTQLGLKDTSFVFAVTAAASLSFMMPMATPPNAIVFSMGHFSLKEMMRFGFVLDLVFGILIAIYCYFIFPYLLIA